ncbi:O-acyltransferase like protein-like [Thrips palmi]|uniref:O-acyltransferase like protein-like n=1 Tax=Thrips palmi TaxID=161013 RepID=A0A6P8ZXX9_THRPL|nr:O-acyltransferase like protein-like [Thrips palmi]
MAGPVVNGVDVEKVYASALDVLLINGSVIVDVFFVAGGCLLSWTLLGHLQRGKQLSLFSVYLYRYLRLVPAYAVIVAVLAVGLPSLGSGPLWKVTVVEEARRCQKRWWANLLFVNNLVRPDEPCLDPSWYLACDVQLFVLATPLVMLAHSKPRLAGRLLGAALLVAVVYPAVVTWRLGLDGTIIPYPDVVGHMAATAIHMRVYVSSLCRAGPYVLGVAAGWHLRHLRAKRQPAHAALSWLLAPLGLLTVAVVLAASVFYPPLVAAAPPRWVHVVYAGTYRTACALSYTAALIVVASRDNSEKSWARCLAAFRPLSRLSYCAFLTHALVQLHSIGQQRSAAVYSTIDTITLAVPDVVFAFALALVLHLTVEAPCSALLPSAKGRGRGAAGSRANLVQYPGEDKNVYFTIYRVYGKAIGRKGNIKTVKADHKGWLDSMIACRPELINAINPLRVLSSNQYQSFPWGMDRMVALVPSGMGKGNCLVKSVTKEFTTALWIATGLSFLAVAFGHSTVLSKGLSALGPFQNYSSVVLEDLRAFCVEQYQSFRGAWIEESLALRMVMKSC